MMLNDAKCMMDMEDPELKQTSQAQKDYERKDTFLCFLIFLSCKENGLTF